jgi:broad specificity phosphatase PhoE
VTVVARAAGQNDRTILLARHGETEWNRIGRWQGATDIPLSDVGRAQARALGARLVGQGIRRVYASHLARARETAEIVAATLGVPAAVTIDPRLRERGYGCFEGLTREECAQTHPEVWQRYLADRRLVPPDAEPQAEIIARATAAMLAIAAGPQVDGGPENQRQDEGSRAPEGGGDAGDGPTLVISHGGTIRIFVHAVVGTMLPPLGNGAIVRLRVGADGRFSLVEDPDPLDAGVSGGAPG